MKDKNTLGKFYERFCFHFFSFSSLGSSKESYPVIRFLKHTTLCRNGVIIILRYEHLMQHRYYMNSVSCHFTSNKLLNEKRNTVERRKKTMHRDYQPRSTSNKKKCQNKTIFRRFCAALIL
jgi:hypothetical protein